MLSYQHSRLRVSDSVSFLGGHMAFFFGKYPQWVRTTSHIIILFEILGMLHTLCNSRNRYLLQSKCFYRDVFGESSTSEMENFEETVKKIKKLIVIL